MKKTLIIVIIIIFLVSGGIMFLKLLPHPLGTCNDPTEEQFAKKLGLKGIKIHPENPYFSYYSDGNKIYQISHGIPCGIDTRETPYDAKSFEILGGGSYYYIKSAEKIYYSQLKYNDETGGLMANADYKSFSVFNIDSPADLAKDKNHIFFGRNIIEGADINTFMPIPQPNDNKSPCFAKDKTNLYILDLLLSDKNLDIQKIDFVDTSTFEIIPDVGEYKSRTNYYRDKNNVYYLKQDQATHLYKMNIINGADPSMFRMLNGLYATDGKTFYEGGKVADESSVQLSINQHELKIVQSGTPQDFCDNNEGDYCLNKNTLWEYVCRREEFKDGVVIYVNEHKKSHCDKGCIDGICLNN